MVKPEKINRSQLFYLPVKTSTVWHSFNSIFFHCTDSQLFPKVVELLFQSHAVHVPFQNGSLQYFLFFITAILGSPNTLYIWAFSLLFSLWSFALSSTVKHHRPLKIIPFSKYHFRHNINLHLYNPAQGRNSGAFFTFLQKYNIWVSSHAELFNETNLNLPSQVHYLHFILSL